MRPHIALAIAILLSGFAVLCALLFAVFAELVGCSVTTRAVLWLCVSVIGRTTMQP